MLIYSQIKNLLIDLNHIILPTLDVSKTNLKINPFILLGILYSQHIIMNEQSDSEIVFSSQDMENSGLAPRILRPQDHSPNLRIGLAKSGAIKEEILTSGFNPATIELSSSGKKRPKKSSDESINDIQARKADHLQKYNVNSLKILFS